MNTDLLDDKNIMTMKLLHYFITEKNYNPIILQGVDNEIWLENLNEDYKVVRIVSNYIHNDEQFNFDVFKTKRIMKKIKKKTLSLSMNSLSIFLDLGENVSNKDVSNFNYIKVESENDLDNSDLIKKSFPDLVKKLTYNEEGLELFSRITNDINEHNRKDAEKVNKVFKEKLPIVTYILIGINVLCFVIPYILGIYPSIVDSFCVHGDSIRAGEYYRLITGIFLHGGVLHLLFNCYALFVLGSQIENFYGKLKYIIIYLFAGLMGSLLSMTFNDSGSIGASGAIFGLMGSLVYFGYHYRVYLGNVVKSQILPLIVLNLALGFMLTGIDNFAHIGGLIGGSIISVGLGVDGKSSTFERVNGFIISAIFLAFAIYMAFVFKMV
ncbi:MAG: rhomboid family intramembrane serine protease [Bacilli bacterium]|nr:rhomboid family intramembrane serine protease [Bacilli bacterium]MBR3049736.1 rhomboid family intramembrane serine protease [Bacilli bacterium]